MASRSTDGPLEYFDVTNLDGLFSLRLTVFRNNGETQTSIVQVTVDNITPTIKIIYPNDGDGYTYPQDEWVNLQFDVKDNVAIGRVEILWTTSPSHGRCGMRRPSATNGCWTPARNWAHTRSLRACTTKPAIWPRAIR